MSMRDIGQALNDFLAQPLVAGFVTTAMGVFLASYVIRQLLDVCMRDPAPRQTRTQLQYADNERELADTYAYYTFWLNKHHMAKPGDTQNLKEAEDRAWIADNRLRILQTLHERLSQEEVQQLIDERMRVRGLN